MLKACSYCGRIHASEFDCGRKPKKKEYQNERTEFRWSNAWKRKRKQIKERDSYLCQCCIRKMKGTVKRYNYDEIEVHHIEPIKEREDLKLEDDNLISLCRVHHEMAEAGAFDRELLHKIARDQERTSNT